MPDYSKCLIYYITTGDSIYVGSTCNFNRRKCKHKQCIENPDDSAYNRKVYQKIRENGEWDMQVYEEFPCESKTQMRIREEEVRIELRADLNQQRCYTSPETRKEQKKKNYEENKEHITQRRRDRYKNETREKEIENSKKYYQENKEQKKEYMRKYYQDKKNKILTENEHQTSSESSENDVELN